MIEVNVTELRNHMHDYLGKVRAGEELLLTWRGEAIARLVPTRDERLVAREKLNELRKKCHVGDVISPVGEAWEAEGDNP